MHIRGRWPLARGGRPKDQGVLETTERVRQLVDGIESAIAAASDLELSAYLAPPALGLLLAASAAMRAEGRTWLPARSGLRWSRSGRLAESPGRFWLRLRFEDRTSVRDGSGSAAAPPTSHEVEVELDATAVPWRLCRVEEVLAV